METNAASPLSHLNDPSLFEQGGPVMYPLLAASIAALAFIIYCFLILRRKSVMGKELTELAETLSNPADCGKAEKVCREEGGPFAEILATVVVTRHLPTQEADSLIEGAGRRAAHDLSRGTLALEVIAGIAPLLGLLGTVTGMFSMMMTIKESGAQEIASISGGIGEALITTIAGLIIAIPAYVAYVYFSRRVEDIVLLMEEYATHLAARLRNRNFTVEIAPEAEPAADTGGATGAKETKP